MPVKCGEGELVVADGGGEGTDEELTMAQEDTPVDKAALLYC